MYYIQAAAGRDSSQYTLASRKYVVPRLGDVRNVLAPVDEVDQGKKERKLAAKCGTQPGPRLR